MMFKPLAAICAASAILIGCGNAGNIVGTWNDPSLGETFVANADGSYSRISQKGNHVMTIVGHYTFKGSTLEMTPTGVQFNKAYTAEIIDHLQTTMAPSFNKPIKANVEFTTPDRVNITQGIMTETLDRAK
jgi:hypothetical protein